MKKLSIVVIIMGILIILYPLLERGYTWYWQRQLLLEYEKEITNNYIEVDNRAAITEYKSLQQFFKVEDEGRIKIEDEFEEENEIEDSKDKLPKISKLNKKNVSDDEKEIQLKKAGVLGIIKIDKIKLKLPILEGATEKNLKKGAARIKGTSAIGEVGNVALAGHRSHTNGRFFNRLDELEVGDQIVIETDNKTYYYKIYKKIIVEPEDISVLDHNNKDHILTLVTCHPLYKATERLIIHAIQVQ